MAQQQKPKVTKGTVDKAEKGWDTFVQWSAISTVAIVAILALMAVTLV